MIRMYLKHENIRCSSILDAEGQKNVLILLENNDENYLATYTTELDWVEEEIREVYLLIVWDSDGQKVYHGFDTLDQVNASFKDEFMRLVIWDKNFEMEVKI